MHKYSKYSISYSNQSYELYLQLTTK